MQSLKLSILALALVVGCSASVDDETTEPAAASTPALAKYCTATLKVEKALQAPAANGAWTEDGSKASPGTTFLLGREGGDPFVGFIVPENGTPHKLADWHAPLVMNEDFTTDCVLDPANSRLVVLERTTLFANPTLTGASCVLETGTDFRGYSYSKSGAAGSPVEFSGDTLAAKCGFAKGYTADLRYAVLNARP